MQKILWNKQFDLLFLWQNLAAKSKEAYFFVYYYECAFKCTWEVPHAESDSSIFVNSYVSNCEYSIDADRQI